MFDLPAVQAALRDRGPRRLAALRLPRPQRAGPPRRSACRRAHMLSRRWFYFIPADGRAAQAGPPHRVRRRSTTCPAARQSTCAGRSWRPASARWSHGRDAVAMEYVPRNANPYVSRVDAGTVELVRSFGVEVVPSGDLVQRFEACWDDEQWAHAPGGGQAHRARPTTSPSASSPSASARRHASRETEVQQRILDHFARTRLD